MLKKTGPEMTADATSPPGEEALRFIRNFNDVFLSVGLAMFIVGLALMSSLVGATMIGGAFNGEVIASSRRAAGIAAAIAAADAVIVWLLGEMFARSRRLFLPAIVILIGFAGFVVVAAAAGYAALIDLSRFDDFEATSLEFRRFLLFLAAAGTLAIFAYYARMKLPFAMGVGAGSLALTGVAAASLIFPELLTVGRDAVSLGIGLFLFALGVFFDARDPERRTRLSDNAFWLHLFAAPMIFFSTRGLLGSGGGAVGATTTLALVLAFAVVSVLINRRALLVSGLVSAAVAVAALVRAAGFSGAWTAALTLTILGGGTVLLGGGWRNVRRVLVAPFPRTGLIARIVPPEPLSERRAPLRGEAQGDEGAARA